MPGVYAVGVAGCVGLVALAQLAALALRAWSPGAGRTPVLDAEATTGG